jgi:hypothetical protein
MNIPLLGQELVDAAKRNDIAAVKSLVDKGAVDINFLNNVS